MAGRGSAGQQHFGNHVDEAARCRDGAAASSVVIGAAVGPMP
jgi:hypothetical protein